MKKIILIIILFFSCLKIINAETYYGEYRKVYDIGKYVDDTVKVENYRLCNTYESKYIDMGYMLESDIYLKDENDYIEDYVNINIDEEGDEYIVIPTNIKRTNEIYFGNIKKDTKIYEIETYENGEKRAFGFVDSERTGLKYLSDKNYETYLDGSMRNSFRINLKDIRNLEEVTIVFYTNDILDYEFNIMNESNKVKFYNYNKNKHIVGFKYIDNNSKENIKYEYKGFKKIYKYYKEEKIPLNNYVISGDNILLDDYIEINEYFVRDKLILSDELIIKSNSFNIENFIEYKTDDVNINCNIDYLVNGIYNCEFVLNDIKVLKNVIVDIKEDKELLDNNVINEDNSLLEDNEIKEDIYLVNNDINIVDNNIKEKVKNKKIIDKKEDKSIGSLSTKKTTTTKLITTKKIINKINLKEENINNNNNLLNKIKYIIIFNLIIIEICLYIRKKKRK